MPIPAHGLPAEELFRRLEMYKERDVSWRAGKILTGIYDPGGETEAVVKEAYTRFLTENALYPNLFPSLLQLENEVVRMVVDLLQGDGEVVGNCTSGGTESIMLAVKSVRDKARVERPEISMPEIVLSQTAHPAFHKAAHYLGLKTIVTPFDLQSFRADPAAMRQAITPNTILLVASAPCYSHGVIDPISEIAEIAREHNLCFHVDACVGGIHLSLLRKAGYPIPPFDLSVPGVTSLSVDMHKYGYAPKNVSVILYRQRALRRYAFFASAETTSYSVLNTTVLSSKSGGPVAGAWAALNYLGEDGYLRIVREVSEATRQMLEGILELDDVYVLGEPAMCMFALASRTLNIFELDDEMTRRGWTLQPQFSAGGGPANLHVSVHYSTVGHVAEFLQALRESIATLKERGNAGAQEALALKAEVERLMAQPDAETFARIVALAGVEPGRLPSNFARINTVLDALPDSLVGTLLLEYLNSLYA
ncbi:aspartate aminotransferase family protein [Ktedonosporobacter rubrisoli]|uniref:Aspartate aminotransferase family protein n=1 Tax=Ktedonosporobacter rubrisoli TaxID=2509675 RepID=A0A4P6JIF1_KTERU|nr:aspartate aminotransferase family protein [Ktedonosporobacter rubrisoli]QBD74847.1 aspartate aminotransferase family protein [Ktedonosporobacter rubrisoli]